MYCKPFSANLEGQDLKSAVYLHLLSHDIEILFTYKQIAKWDSNSLKNTLLILEP